MKYPLFGKLMDTLKQKEYSWDEEIAGIRGTITSVRSGGILTIEDHIKALVLALLSSGRVWTQIVPYIRSGAIDKIFYNYNPASIKAASPANLISGLKAIGCGNRTMHVQMNGMKHNVEVLEKMYADPQFDMPHGYSGFTYNVNGTRNVKNTIDLMYLLARGAGRRFAAARDYKIQGADIPLVCEYLKNVGVDIIKPDVHVCRILGRLGYHSVNYASNPKPSTTTASFRDAIEVCYEIADEYGLMAIEVDTILWQYCAKGKAEICTDKPDCSVCHANCGCVYYADVQSGKLNP